MNTVYERFFQGYSVKVAATHGIVYTPQEIVDFMCASVEQVLKTEFGKRLGSPGVNILDCCTDSLYSHLHHPRYREKFADTLKRALPRIPLAPDFRAFADAGRKLADLHLNYEQLEPYPLDWVESPDVLLSYRVEMMRLSKDKTSLVVNDSLTLTSIPPEVFDYRLGNRSALDWVIDQYGVKTDKRSGITSDPNRADDSKYIVRLVGQVVRVSIETVKIVSTLPASYSRD